MGILAASGMRWPSRGQMTGLSMMKNKPTWHEYALSVWLVLGALVGVIHYGVSRGDWGGSFAFVVMPLICWSAFCWWHCWCMEPKPLTWADTVIGVIAWVGALSVFVPKT